MGCSANQDNQLPSSTPLILYNTIVIIRLSPGQACLLAILYFRPSLNTFCGFVYGVGSCLVQCVIKIFFPVFSRRSDRTTG